MHITLVHQKAALPWRMYYLAGTSYILTLGVYNLFGKTIRTLKQNTIMHRYNPGGKLTYSVMPAEFINQSWFPDMSMTTFPGRT